MNFVRSEAGLRKNCRLGPREQFNEVSSVLDAGTVYSNDPELLEELRFACLQYSKNIIQTSTDFFCLNQLEDMKSGT